MSKNPNVFGIIAFIIIMIFAYIRWKAQQNVDLIRKYKQAMNLLGKVCLPESENNRFVFYHADFQNKTLLGCWRNYHNLMSTFLEARYKKLNAEMDRVIRYPYLLLSKNKTSLMVKEFEEIRRTTEHLYNEFRKMNTEEKNTFDYSNIDKAFENLNSALISAGDDETG